MRSFIGVLLCALCFSAAPAMDAHPSTAPYTHLSYGEKLTVPGIHNFGKISDQLYRGAQPSASGVEQLKRLGVTTIVDLRREDGDERNAEKQEAAAAGIRFMSIPVGGWDAPAHAQIAEFLSIFEDTKQTVFVHCHFGEDRTGVFVAAYRMAVQQWSARQAVEEMRFFGFHTFWHRAMTSFVEQFPAVLSSSSAFAVWRDSMPAIAAVAPKN